MQSTEFWRIWKKHLRGFCGEPQERTYPYGLFGIFGHFIVEYLNFSGKDSHRVRFKNYRNKNQPPPVFSHLCFQTITFSFYTWSCQCFLTLFWMLKNTVKIDFLERLILVHKNLLVVCFKLVKQVLSLKLKINSKDGTCIILLTVCCTTSLETLQKNVMKVLSNSWPLFHLGDRILLPLFVHPGKKTCWWKLMVWMLG